jgi:hypothetical protein
MSETNNRNKQGPGLQDVREGGGGLPDAGTKTGSLQGYPGLGSGIDDIGRIGSVNGNSDAPGSSNDLPNMTDDFSGSTSGNDVGSMGGLGSTGSDPMDQTLPSKAR